MHVVSHVGSVHVDIASSDMCGSEVDLHTKGHLGHDANERLRTDIASMLHDSSQAIKVF